MSATPSSKVPSVDAEVRLARDLALLIAGLTVARLIVAATIGLSYDEALLVVKSHHLRLSYFDHPPLASLLIALAQALFGSSPMAARLPSIAMFAGTTWLIFRIGALLFSPLAGFWGAVALSLSPLFGFYFGALAVTDSPMLFCVAATVLCLCHALFSESHPRRWWLAAGLFAGLAMLSKSFSALLLLPGILMFLLTTPHHRRWLARPEPYLAATVMLATLAPVLVWNAQNEWINLSFPGGHPLIRGWMFAPVRLLSYWTVQAAIILPWIWAGLIAALIWAFARGRSHAGSWLLAWLASAPLLAFTLVRLLSADRKGFHWAAPGYLMLFPLLGALLATMAPRLRRRAVRLTAATLTVAGAVLVGHALTGIGQRVVPQFQVRDPVLADTAGWDVILDAITQHEGDAGQFIAGLRWEDCAKIAVAVRTVPVMCFTPFPEIFAYLFDPRPLLGRNAIIVVREQRGAAVPLADYFEHVEPLDTITVMHFQARALRLRLYRGHKLRAFYPWPYGPFQPGISTRP